MTDKAISAAARDYLAAATEKYEAALLEQSARRDAEERAALERHRAICAEVTAGLRSLLPEPLREFAHHCTQEPGPFKRMPEWGEATLDIPGYAPIWFSFRHVPESGAWVLGEAFKVSDVADHWDDDDGLKRLSWRRTHDLFNDLDFALGLARRRGEQMERQNAELREWQESHREWQESQPVAAESLPTVEQRLFSALRLFIEHYTPEVRND